MELRSRALAVQDAVDEDNNRSGRLESWEIVERRHYNGTNGGLPSKRALTFLMAAVGG
jgi:hypothetical protein